MTVLHRFHVEYPGTTVWLDITSRVIGDVQWTEGRNLSLLGGPLPPAVPATLQCTLDNATGYFTKGAGSALGPGARFRLQWRATTSDAWTTRYVGRLSERRVRFQGSSRILTRWYGVLLYLTAGELPPRSYGGGTPQRTIGLMCDTVGVPTVDRQFDTDTDNFPFTATETGYGGVRQFENLVNGFIYDTPDGKIRLELPPTRMAKAVSGRYSDAPNANELGIPPPEVQTNPFGIINHVTAELRVYEPTTGDMGTGVGMEAAQHYELSSNLASDNRTLTFSVPLGFEASEGLQISEWRVQVRAVIRFFNGSTETVAEINHPNTTATGTAVLGPIDYDVGATASISFDIQGDTVQVSIPVALTLPGMGGSTLRISVFLSRSVTHHNMGLGVQDIYAVLQHTETYSTSVEDLDSQELHGVRRRMSPLVASQFVADLDNFTPDLTFLETHAQAELDRFKNPQEVYIVDTTAATDTERTALLARRLSDKVHLRLAGPSQLSVDADFFVEAMQTTLTPEGNATQRLHVVEGPPPEAPTDAPTGFTVTRNSASRATLAWDSGTIAAARFNIYRGDAANNLTLLRGDFGDGATVEYIDNTISSPNEYWYAVAAENNGGEGPQTAAMRAGWPQQPTGFQVFRLDNMSLLLFWDNPNDSGITGYRIWRGTSSGNINAQIENSVGSASTTQYTDDGLTDGQEYWYQIQALYGVIASVRSDSASGIP